MREPVWQRSVKTDKVDMVNLLLVWSVQSHVQSYNISTPFYLKIRCSAVHWIFLKTSHRKNCYLYLQTYNHWMFKGLDTKFTSLQYFRYFSWISLPRTPVSLALGLLWLCSKISRIFTQLNANRLCQRHRRLLNIRWRLNREFSSNNLQQRKIRWVGKMAVVTTFSSVR